MSFMIKEYQACLHKRYDNKRQQREKEKTVSAWIQTLTAPQMQLCLQLLVSKTK